MPATEETAYPIKRLHRIFAGTSLLLLATTIWLLVADHRRSWKQYQRAANEIQQRMLGLQKTEQERVRAELEELQAAGEPVTREGRDVRQALATSRSELDRLDDLWEAGRRSWFEFERGIPRPGKKLLELPILDAFNSPLRVHNLWAEGLTQDYHFRQVPRYDRCTTCHTAIQRNVPVHPGRSRYPLERVLEFSLQISETGSPGSVNPTTLPADRMAQAIGLGLAGFGLTGDEQVSIAFVRPDSPAARARLVQEPSPEQDAEAVYAGLLWPPDEPLPSDAARGLQPADVLLAIDGRRVEDRAWAVGRLLNAESATASEADANGRSLTLIVRRGVPHPFTSHPRLDLFVGDSSPHTLSEFACTICHGGQGSATDFQWASHAPNSIQERVDWRKDHGWFDNPHWDDPMFPARFAESACLKCHHRVADLQPTERFPDPPAPKLVRGHQLILAYGCFGCHEINGFENGRSIGPDVRLEPLTEPLVTDPDVSLRPSAAPDAERADPPGQLRRPGPSLRHVAQKLTTAFLVDWTRAPQRFRPGTRMPRAFGLWSHLDGQARGLAEQFEPLEISGIAAYLQARSEPMDAAARPEGITPSEAETMIERGRQLFLTRGCLACHDHQDFPDAAQRRDSGQTVLGPDLSAVADKLVGPSRRQWLIDFLRQPTRYDPRTMMPDMYLGPLEKSQAEGEQVVRTDPAEDIAVYLLASSSQGYSAPAVIEPPADVLDRLVVEYLSDAYPVARAEEYARRGIPAGRSKSIRDAERELVVAEADYTAPEFRLSPAQKLQYVGYQSIAKYGCFGCHEIAGFERSKPIGPALTDWGRVDPHQLAFESIQQYADRQARDAPRPGEPARVAPHGVTAASLDRPPYYLWQLRAQTRIGFAFQKLTEPRSFDFQVVQDRSYNERLRMHQFPFEADEREAILTFILGLVAQPPSDKYVYSPNNRRAALIQGQIVLDRYQCNSCHMLRPQHWKLSFPPGTFGAQPDQPTFSFVPHAFTAAELARSERPNHDGRLRATLAGMPLLGVDGRPLVFDDYGDELFEDEQYDLETLEYAFQLWQPAAIDGNGYQVGGPAINIWGDQIEDRRPADGGFLTKYLLPHVVEIERRSNPNALGSQAWGWLPPSLWGEGRKVRPDWLHSYLLEPDPIRPASFMRMPRFTFSAGEATALVNYFAARDQVEAPHEFVERRRSTYLARADRAYREGWSETPDAADTREPSRLGDAMRIVSDRNYCVTCHIIGDFQPVTSDRAKGPDLAAAYQRFRPDYLRRWVAKPTSILPYTSMQVVIPYAPDQEHLGGVPQALYRGTSVEQLDAVIDLLLNFDVFARQQDGLVAPRNGAQDGSVSTGE